MPIRFEHSISESGISFPGRKMKSPCVMSRSFSVRSMSRARHSFPGPRHSSLSGFPPRRRGVAATPRGGRRARRGGQ